MPGVGSNLAPVTDHRACWCLSSSTGRSMQSRKRGLCCARCDTMHGPACFVPGFVTSHMASEAGRGNLGLVSRPPPPPHPHTCLSRP